MQQTAFTCFVLDDDVAVNEVICGILARGGVAFRSFVRLEAMLEAMAEGPCDLLFLDVRLEDADAVEAIRRLHAIGYGGAIQVVSGLSSPQLNEIYRMLERYGYGKLYPIAKPFRLAAIKAALAEVMTLTPGSPSTEAASASTLIGGWMSDSAENLGVMVVQPQLDHPEQQTDLLAEAPIFESTLKSVLHDIRLENPAGPAELWLHMTAGVALNLRLFSLAAELSGSPASQLSIIVPSGQLTAAPDQFEDLRTRLGVYGIRAGIYTQNLHEISINSLARLRGGRLVLGQGGVSQILVSASGRTLGENIIGACRDKSISVAAILPSTVDDPDELLELGMEWLITPIARMTPLSQLREQEKPHFGHAARQSGEPLQVLSEFLGRHLLSQREIEIVGLTAAGLSAKEAGRSLGLSHRTIEVHRSNIFAKLGVKNVAQLISLVSGLR